MKMETNGMNKVRITAIRQTVYPDLMAKYENPIEHTCDDHSIFISLMTSSGTFFPSVNSMHFSYSSMRFTLPV